MFCVVFVPKVIFTKRAAVIDPFFHWLSKLKFIPLVRFI
jgi:hypothetical protein